MQIGDSLLYAISQDNLKMLDRLMDYVKQKGGGGGGVIDSDEFPPYVTPLLLAAQCGRYETVMYLMKRGHRLDRPHPPRCACPEQCQPRDRPVDRVAEGCKRLNTYRAMADPTYVCCTSAADPILACFRLYDELLECSDVDQMYKVVYTIMAQQVTALSGIQ